MDRKRVFTAQPILLLTMEIVSSPRLWQNNAPNNGVGVDRVLSKVKKLDKIGQQLGFTD